MGKTADKLCRACGEIIDPERVECMPDTDLCISCADSTGPVLKAYMVFSHKTAPELMIVDGRNAEHVRLADRANARSR